MKYTTVEVRRYDADDGYVFDWADLTNHTTVDEDGNEIPDHLFAKTVFLSSNDDIRNYIEVEIEKTNLI